MPRLLVICRHPYHLRGREAEHWLTEEVGAVLRRDGLQGATLTRLASPSASPAESEPGWLVELRLGTAGSPTTIKRGDAFGELVADLRLLGMSPMVFAPDDRSAIELRPS